MNILKVRNYHEMSLAGAVIIHEAVVAKLSKGEHFNLGLATGNTMIELYEILAGMFNEKKWIFPSCKHGIWMNMPWMNIMQFHMTIN